MLFSDLVLSQRLEHAEGHACAQYAETRQRLYPHSGAEWIECAGTRAIFDGIESPITQTFGLGLNEELKEASLDIIERFFLDREAPIHHEVSPFVGAAALEMLCRRNYRPIELNNVLYQTIERPPDSSVPGPISVRTIAPEEAQLWSDVSARGWSHEFPALGDFLLEFGAIAAACAGNLCFLAEYEGKPGAAGVMHIQNGVALLGGSSTVPELRRRGLQTSLISARMRCAFDRACDIAMMVALPGSNSQHNVERKGFRIAYTRTKWKLFS